MTSQLLHEASADERLNSDSDIQILFLAITKFKESQEKKQKKVVMMNM